MSKPKMQHCFNCGEALGVYETYCGDGPEVCGSSECNREARNAESEARASRFAEAMEDDFNRYNGGW